MRKFAAALAGVAMLLLGGFRAEAGTLSLSMHDGLVTLTAQAATIGEVIAEWQKVGHTIFINADRLTGPPLTLQLTNVPERQALDLILHSAAGYMAAPREQYLPGASVYDRVFVLATSTPPPPLPHQPASRFPQPFFPNANAPRVPVFRPRLPTPTPAPAKGAESAAEDEDDSVQAPAPGTVITAPVATPQPGVVVVPPKKKPDGGER